LEVTNERYQLLDSLEALREEEVRNRELYCKPVIAKKEHVKHYFQTYEEYLELAVKHGIVGREFAVSRSGRLTKLPIHRDTMGSLMGMVGELTARVKSSLNDHEKEFAELKTENEKLKEELEGCKKELASFEKVR
jgi:hypothetical protein